MPMSEKPMMSVEQYSVVNLASETQFSANGIVSRTLMRTGSGRVVLFGFDLGQELTEHTSTSAAIVHLLTGEADFLLDGKLHHLKAGDLLYMPPNLPHAVKATHKFSMLLTLIKEPKPETKTKA
jgi:quercetin dioxygenase-like cupin family protein